MFVKNISKTPKKQLESEIKSKIRKALRAQGWFVVNHWQGMGSYRGFPDLTATKNGTTVYIECKTPRQGSKQFSYQLQFQKDIEAHGATYIVARSIDDLKELLGPAYAKFAAKQEALF